MLAADYRSWGGPRAGMYSRTLHWSDSRELLDVLDDQLAALIDSLAVSPISNEARSCLRGRACSRRFRPRSG